MTGVIGAGVSLEGIFFPDFEVTMLISGTVTKADEGKAVAIDNTASNTVKLAADGDPVFGRLQAYENRVQEGIKVATVATKFIATLPIKAASGVARGDSIQGAGAGEIKPIGVSAATDVNSKYVLNSIVDLTNGDSGYVVAPLAGTITKIQSVLLGGAVTTNDAVVTGKIGSTAITNGVVTIAQDGSAIGDVDVASPSAANVVAAGDLIKFTVSGTPGGSRTANMSILVNTGMDGADIELSSHNPRNRVLELVTRDSVACAVVAFL